MPVALGAPARREANLYCMAHDACGHNAVGVYLHIATNMPHAVTPRALLHTCNGLLLVFTGRRHIQG